MNTDLEDAIEQKNGQLEQLELTYGDLKDSHKALGVKKEMVEHELNIIKDAKIQAEFQYNEYVQPL